ncbi:hypothetical protein [Streptomyces sp. NPDC006879]|uniref:hypothetical protein n=1 Tax=Streptomyces sp. NPDC006879 TaxID=3364767 RepID=UPI0036A65F1A
MLHYIARLLEVLPYAFGRLPVPGETPDGYATLRRSAPARWQGGLKVASRLTVRAVDLAPRVSRGWAVAA